jgi:hypothetical protein
MSVGDFMPYYKQPDHIATVQEALTQHNVDDLKKLAAFVPGDKIPTRKNDLVEYILPHLQGASLKNLWSQCDQVQQAAIAETVYSATDKYQKIKFANKYGGSPKWGSSSGYSYNNNPTILGLFFYCYTMPVELKQRLKAFVPEPEPAHVNSHENIPSVLPYEKGKSDNKSNNIELPLQMRETEQVARRELISMLRLVDLGKVAISDKTLYPTGATLNNITAILEEGDYYSEWKIEKSPQGYKYDYPIGSIKPFGWVMILQVGKLVEISGKQLALTKAGQKALREPAEKTLQTLWKNWQKNTLLDELRRIEGIKGQTGKGKSSLTALSGRRSPIAAALKECPVGRWVKLTELCRYMLAAEHDLLVSRNLEHLTINGSSGSYYESDFLTVEARYLACVLFEYAATMGLIDISFLHPDDGFVNFVQSKDRYYYSYEPLSRYDGLTYFRLTPLGAYILGITDRYIPQALPQKQILQISANLEVVAIEQLSRTDRLVLDSCLQPISDSVWQVDSGKLLDAVSQGRNINELKDFLVANSGTDLPQTVSKVLADLQARTSSLQDLGTARLVRCSDSALATLIANDARTKAFCFLADQPAVMALGKPCYLVVPIATEVKFHNALKKIGYCL